MITLSKAVGDSIYSRYQNIALCAIYLLAFSDQIFPKIGDYSQALIILPAFLCVCLGVRITALKFPLLLFLLAIVIQVSSWYFSQDLNEDAMPRIDRLGRWFLFIFLAFWMTNKLNIEKNILYFALLGTAISPWVIGEGWKEITEAYQGARIDFGYANSQHTAMIFGSLAIGFYAFLISSIRPEKILTKNNLALFFSLTLCLFGLVATQTRAVWIGVTLGILAITIIHVLILISSGKFSRKTIYCLSSIFIFVLLFLSVLSGGAYERFSMEKDVIKSLKDHKEIASNHSSAGIRITLWSNSIPKIIEKPITGWGTTGSYLVVAEIESLQREHSLGLGHLHNTYLDIAVQYGLLAVLLYTLLLYWLGQTFWNLWRKGLMPNASFLFSMGFLLYWVFINFFESYMIFSSGRYVFNMAFAGLLCYKMKKRPIE